MRHRFWFLETYILTRDTTSYSIIKYDSEDREGMKFWHMLQRGWTLKSLWKEPVTENHILHDSIHVRSGEENCNWLRTLAWKIPWAEEPGRLQSMGSQSDMTEWLNHSYEKNRENL